MNSSSSNYQQLTIFGEKIPAVRYIVKSVKKFSTDKMNKKAAMMGSKDQSWTTPLWFYNELKKERDIENYDTDPATNPSNPLNCKYYYTEKEDGLKQKWYGNVFINPPFGFGYYEGKWTYYTGRWIEEAWRRVNQSKDDVKRVTMIIPSRCDTKAFHKYCWDYDKAQARAGMRVNFYPKRIAFGNGNEAAPFVTMILDFIRIYSN